MAAAAPIDADQMAQQVNMALSQLRPVGRQPIRQHGLRQLGAGLVEAVVVGDLAMPGHQIAQQAEGPALGLRDGTAAKHCAALGLGPGPDVKVMQQPALANAGLGHHRHGCQPALCKQLTEGRLQGLQLGLASDGAGGHAFDASGGGAPGRWHEALHQVAQHRLGHALDDHRRLRLHLELAAHLGKGGVADAQAGGRRGLFHARRHVDGRAADGAVGVDTATQQHAASVDADPHLEAGRALLARLLDTGWLANRQQGQATAHGPLGIVLARAVGPKTGQQVVASKLQHSAAMAPDDQGPLAQRTVHHRVYVLRV